MGASALPYRSGDRAAHLLRLHESVLTGSDPGGGPAASVDELHDEVERRSMHASWVATDDPDSFRAAGYRDAMTLPVRLCVPVASARRVITYEAEPSFLESRRFDPIVSDLDDFPVDGWVQRWSPDDLRERLGSTERPYHVHVGPWVVGVSMRSSIKGIPVALLLKLLPRGGRGGSRRAADIMSAACRSHHVPLGIYAGINAHAAVRGVRIPPSWLSTPTNVMLRSNQARDADDMTFEILELLDVEAG